MSEAKRASDVEPEPAAVQTAAEVPPAFDSALSTQHSVLLHSAVGLLGDAERLAEEMAGRWRRGERPAAEEYLDRLPGLRDDAEAAVELIYEEVCLRQQYGPPAGPDEFLRRFPQWQAELAVLLDCHRLLEPGRPVPRYPAVGDSVVGYTLRAELGRGAQGRVFLATQPALADRVVVLKLVPWDGREHLALARLQHPHVVPLYGVQDDADRHLRVLCMPYLGGTTLARALELLQDRPLAGRTGRDLLQALGHDRAPAPALLPGRSPSWRTLARASYPQAVAWIGARLAEALQYAHERGLVHLDLKPSNVLLAADGQPMLLDFHLAREPVRPGGPATFGLGGTPQYMSPEQQAALADVRAGRDIAAPVDGRSDVYSLGLVLYRALGGLCPTGPGACPPLRRRNQAVSTGLSDVIGKCLATDPAHRYPDAAALAADLQRYLEDRPLRGVPNRNPAERWRCWRRRHPHGLAVAGMGVALVLSLSVGAAHYVKGCLDGRAFAQRSLDAARDSLGRGQYGRAAEAAAAGADRAARLPFATALGEELEQVRGRALREQTADHLHRLADRLRFAGGIDTLPAAHLAALEADCRRVWERRAAIVAEIAPDRADPGSARVHDDLLDLAVLWAGLRVRLAPAAAVTEARREALTILDEAEAWWGPSACLCRERQVHAEALGLAAVAQAAARRAAELPPHTAWEHYALGRALLQAGDARAAAARFDRALDLEREALWPSFYRGLCALRLGEPDDAVTAFTTCVAQNRASAGCYYNRAIAYAARARRHDPERALRDYTTALSLDEHLAPAALNRGILHYRAGRYVAAVTDLQRALQDGADPGVAHYNLALVYRATGELGKARESAQAALRHRPAHAEAAKLLASLQAR